MTTKVKLKDVTFTRGAKPIKTLLWCNTQKRAKRNKPAKLNGVVVTNSIEVFHEQIQNHPLQLPRCLRF